MIERLLPGNWEGTTRRLRVSGVVLSDAKMNPLAGDNDDAKGMYVRVPAGGYVTTARNLVFFRGDSGALHAVVPEDGPFEFTEDGLIFLVL